MKRAKNCHEIKSYIVFGICEYCSLKGTVDCNEKTCAYTVWVARKDLKKMIEKLFFDIGEEVDSEGKERLELLKNLINFKYGGDIDYGF